MSEEPETENQPTQTTAGKKGRGEKTREFLTQDEADELNVLKNRPPQTRFDELAEILNYNPSTVCRIFKREIRISPEGKRKLFDHLAKKAANTDRKSEEEQEVKPTAPLRVDTTIRDQVVGLLDEALAGWGDIEIRTVLNTDGWKLTVNFRGARKKTQITVSLPSPIPNSPG